MVRWSFVLSWGKTVTKWGKQGEHGTKLKGGRTATVQRIQVVWGRRKKEEEGRACRQ